MTGGSPENPGPLPRGAGPQGFPGSVPRSPGCRWSPEDLEGPPISSWPSSRFWGPQSQKSDTPQFPDLRLCSSQHKHICF